MDVTNLIESLYQHYEDYGQGYTQDFFKVCSDCKEAANKLGELQAFIDDMLGDHYVDQLDFYTNRCRELEEQLENNDKNFKWKGI